MKQDKSNLHDSSNRDRSAAENIDSTFSVSAPEFKPTVGASNLQLKENPLQMSEIEEEESMQMKKDTLQLKGEEEEESMQMKKDTFQLKGEEEEESMQMKKDTLQLKGEEEEESMQMKKDTFQLKGEEEEESMQMKKDTLQLKGEEEEESMQMKKDTFQLKGEEEDLQMKRGNGNSGSKKSESATKATLPQVVQQKMESSLNADFANVDIYSNSGKAENLGAQAYAQGNEVHFAPGKYNPGSKSGQELIGHELTHVVQQREGRVQATTQRKGTQVNDSEALEKEADEKGKQAAENKSTAKNHAPTQPKFTSPAIQKKEGDGEKMLGFSQKAVALHEAMDGLFTDEAAINRVLLPLSKNAVVTLKRVYKALYGRDLLAHLRSALNDSEFRTALIYMFYYPPQNDIIGSYQSNLAKEKILDMSGWQVSMFSDLLDMLNHNQCSYLWKALAAGNDIIALIKFAYKIKGKDDNWLQNNLQLTNQTDGKGLQQQWNDSCGPTTAQAVHGQLDPIYALNVRESNTNINKSSTSNPGGYNSNAAADQKNLLEWGGGKAVARGATGGDGMGMGDVMTIIEDRTGIDYDVTFASDKEAAMTRIDEILGQGIPVPVRVGGTNGGHFVLITHKSGNSYNIHDVWEGRSFTRSKSNFVNNTMNIAGWPNFTHYGDPD